MNLFMGEQFNIKLIFFLDPSDVFTHNFNTSEPKDFAVRETRETREVECERRCSHLPMSWMVNCCSYNCALEDTTATASYEGKWGLRHLLTIYFNTLGLMVVVLLFQQKWLLCYLGAKLLCTRIILFFYIV